MLLDAPQCCAFGCEIASPRRSVGSPASAPPTSNIESDRSNTAPTFSTRASFKRREPAATSREQRPNTVHPSHNKNKLPKDALGMLVENERSINSSRRDGASVLVRHSNSHICLTAPTTNRTLFPCAIYESSKVSPTSTNRVLSYMRGPMTLGYRALGVYGVGAVTGRVTSSRSAVKPAVGFDRTQHRAHIFGSRRVRQQ
jgi:hypothetical protein